jgi:DNA-binding response OmpR family regulator
VKRVLVVDDDPLICKIVSAGLEAARYLVKTVPNGQAAFSLVRIFPFDLILLDIVMPEMDGFQVLRQLRSLPETALVPVIFLTSQNQERDRVMGFKLGADDYLPKPFDINELVLRVATVLKRAPQRREKPGLSASLQGSLGEIGLGPLLTLIEMEGKSGLLRLAREDSKCILYIKDGNVIRTRRNTGGLRDEEIVYDCLAWTEGSFHFKAERVTGAIEIEKNTIQLLMAFSRRMDEKLD